MNSRNLSRFHKFPGSKLKKNKRTNNPALLVSAQLADSKLENKTKNKIYSIIYTEFLLFSRCRVVKKEKNFFTIQKLFIYTVKRKNLGRIPKIAPGGNPKKKPSPLFYVATSS